jgi:hypothetical protein
MGRSWKWTEAEPHTSALVERMCHPYGSGFSEVTRRGGQPAGPTTVAAPATSGIADAHFHVTGMSFAIKDTMVVPDIRESRSKAGCCAMWITTQRPGGGPKLPVKPAGAHPGG